MATAVSSIGIGPKYPFINAYLQKLAAQAALEEAEKKSYEEKKKLEEKGGAPLPSQYGGETKGSPVPYTGSPRASATYGTAPAYGSVSGAPQYTSGTQPGLGLGGASIADALSVPVTPAGRRQSLTGSFGGLAVGGGSPRGSVAPTQYATGPVPYAPTSYAQAPAAYGGSPRAAPTAYTGSIADALSVPVTPAGRRQSLTGSFGGLAVGGGSPRGSAYNTAPQYSAPYPGSQYAPATQQYGSVALPTGPQPYNPALSPQASYSGTDGSYRRY